MLQHQKLFFNSSNKYPVAISVPGDRWCHGQL